MKGTRPLTDTEIRKVSEAFGGTYEIRNRCLFQLGISTGGRISELLTLTVGDVWQNGSAVSDILFDKSIVKGGEVSRTVPLNADGKDAIESLVSWHKAMYEKVSVSCPFFPSRNGKGLMSRQNAHKMLKAAFVSAGLNGKLATHSMRKSFAQRLYHRTGDIFCVQEMLGHQSVSTTQAYLGVDYQKVKSAMDAMCLFQDACVSINGVSEHTDEVLLVELARRGYDISHIEKVKGDKRS